MDVNVTMIWVSGSQEVNAKNVKIYMITVKLAFKILSQLWLLPAVHVMKVSISKINYVLSLFVEMDQ